MSSPGAAATSVTAWAGTARCQVAQIRPFKKYTQIIIASNIPTLGIWIWALQGVSGIGHSRETLGLGTPGVSKVGLWHSRESLGVDRARRKVPGEEKS